MRVELTVEQFIAFAIDFLIAEGIDEDAHFRDVWQELDDDDLERTLNDPNAVLNVLKHLRKSLIARLRQVLEHRRREFAKVPWTIDA